MGPAQEKHFMSNKIKQDLTQVKKRMIFMRRHVQTHRITKLKEGHIHWDNFITPALSHVNTFLKKIALCYQVVDLVVADLALDDSGVGTYFLHETGGLPEDGGVAFEKVKNK